MNTVTLYRYTHPNGGTTVSPIKPETEDYTEAFRLIADEDKAVTQNGVDLFPCVDVDSIEGWYEVDAPEEEDEESETPSRTVRS